MSDFQRIEDLVQLLLQLNSNDEKYEKYLEYKRTGVTNSYLRECMRTRLWKVDAPFHESNFITATECLVCKRIHENLKREKEGLEPIKYQATVEHYGCPKPLKFKGESSQNNLLREDNSQWAFPWQWAQDEAEVFSMFWAEGKYNFTKRDVVDKQSKLRYLKQQPIVDKKP